MDIFPDFGAVGGTAELRAIVGALLTFVLIFAVLMLVICAIVWAISSSSGNISSAVRARTGFLVSIGAAALAGAGVTWVNFLLGVGASI
ncbi:hypothetical protein E3T24_13960 [Cryobacterium sp. TmT2-59]|uniref:Integral membrane protein n=1 Tax=Cryobacterium shii TaxID=1259235 RepID=A0AAQ2HF77_9MICO|nr:MULTISPECIES: DUF6112 family protein [Cryobacterium]TFC44875.1 hypothetical protein E3O49_11240 [Cryobacterium shii]TFC82151.1 hypothetical protein E3T24_13960 [Cryobacterium sp. TmT2-59]